MTAGSDRRRLFVDIETFSSVDITKSGAFKYIESPDFEILLIAYAWDYEHVRVVRPSDMSDELLGVAAALMDPEVIKVAHNAAFERAAFTKFCGRDMPPEEWEDTMIMAAMNGLPMSLDAAGAALKLTDQKLKSGKLLINYFCKPCKPTGVNGGRTRNLPEQAPEKWQTFVEYCRRDVEVTQAIHKRLAAFPVPAWEQRVRALDARINERGVLVDLDLAESAVALDEEFVRIHTDELARLTGLDNPNSLTQLKSWLIAAGVDCDSLTKSAVVDLLQRVTDPTTKRVLKLRQQLGKTSTTKYKAMTQAACADHRIRGLLQYYGAGRTGRWAGRLVQVQNLPQNHLNQLGEVREIVRARDLDSLEMCFDSVPDVLSQLIRTAFIAPPGHTLLVADYSAIEARVIAYLAGEQWRLDTFAQGGDIYCSSASQMFKVPVEKHGVNGHLRQKGKIAELACIAEGQLVLTDVGLVPIERVTEQMKVWDGLAWVNHAGVVCKGEKEVMTYGGLEATPDHIVWAEIKGTPRAIRFRHAAACRAHLVQAGAGGDPVRVGRDNQPRETVERTLEPLLRSNKVQRLRKCSVARFGEPTNWEIQRVSKLQSASSCPTVVGQEVYSGETTVYQPQGYPIQKLRSSGDQVQLYECNRGVSVHDRNPGATVEGYGTGPNRRKRALRARKFAVGDARGEYGEPAYNRTGSLEPCGMAVYPECGNKEAITGFNAGADNRGRIQGCERKTKRMAANRRKVKVYDLLNAGPRNRFTVSGVLVHNCGYGGGVGALKAFGADKMGLSDEEMQTIVAQWRLASPSIPRFWRQAETAAKTALAQPGHMALLPCGVTYYKDADALRCELPSGRVLSYWAARIEDGTIVFMGQNQTTRKFEKTETWGGKLVENIVQAYARDCLAVAMLRLDRAGYKIVFSVHDEIIAEEPKGGRTWQDMAKIMAQPIDWAPGLLLRGDGYETDYYRKD